MQIQKQMKVFESASIIKDKKPKSIQGDQAPNSINRIIIEPKVAQVNQEYHGNNFAFCTNMEHIPEHS